MMMQWVLRHTEGHTDPTGVCDLARHVLMFSKLPESFSLYFTVQSLKEMSVFNLLLTSHSHPNMTFVAVLLSHFSCHWSHKRYHTTTDINKNEAGVCQPPGQIAIVSIFFLQSASRSNQTEMIKILWQSLKIHSFWQVQIQLNIANGLFTVKVTST